MRDLLKELESDVPGQGVIRIYQSPAIAALVRMCQPGDPEVSGDRHRSMQGYRVQIYSGNAVNSKEVAAERSAQVRAHFPELTTETIYNAPFWRVQVGDFVSREEAQECLECMREAFPSHGRGMYIVRTTVKVPL